LAFETIDHALSNIERKDASLESGRQADDDSLTPKTPPLSEAMARAKMQGSHSGGKLPASGSSQSASDYEGGYDDGSDFRDDDALDDLGGANLDDEDD